MVLSTRCQQDEVTENDKESVKAIVVADCFLKIFLKLVLFNFAINVDVGRLQVTVLFTANFCLQLFELI